MRNGIEQLRYRRFVGERGVGDKPHARVRVIGKALSLCLARAGDMAVGARVEQRAHHGNTERAGPAGDDGMTIAKVHESSGNRRVLPCGAYSILTRPHIKYSMTPPHRR